MNVGNRGPGPTAKTRGVRKIVPLETSKLLEHFVRISLAVVSICNNMLVDMAVECGRKSGILLIFLEANYSCKCLWLLHHQRFLPPISMLETFSRAKRRVFSDRKCLKNHDERIGEF